LDSFELRRSGITPSFKILKKYFSDDGQDITWIFEQQGSAIQNHQIFEIYYLFEGSIIINLEERKVKKYSLQLAKFEGNNAQEDFLRIDNANDTAVKDFENKDHIHLEGKKVELYEFRGFRRLFGDFNRFAEKLAGFKPIQDSNLWNLAKQLDSILK
jgi:hypothetical protein